MKVKEKKTYVSDIDIAIVCDLCGRRSENETWSESPHGRETVTLRHVDTESYPEDTFGKELVLDFCPDCLENKILPWLESQGVKAVYRDLPE